MAAHQAERYLTRTVQSVLAQTHQNMELLAVDDGSTDRTFDILSSISDKRLKILRQPRNMGVVAARNRAAAVAKGKYIAIADADDICQPLRFEKQCAYLEQNERTVVIASEMSTLENGNIRRTRAEGSMNPRIVDWMLHIGNPVGHPSVMFRADLLARLGSYLHQDMIYAEDYDFLHRALRLGDVQVLPECLVLYRRHSGSLTATRQAEIAVKTTDILENAYRRLIADQAPETARLIARYLIAAEPIQTRRDMQRLGQQLSGLVDAYLHTIRPSAEDREHIVRHVGKRWWQRVVLPALRSGRVIGGLAEARSFEYAGAEKPATPGIARSVLSGLFPAKKQLRSSLAFLSSAVMPRRLITSPRTGTLGLEGEASCPDDPPTMYVVVDTEAAFDWSGPFDRRHQDVSSISAQSRAQNIFDEMGFRPIYVVDYTVASQAQGYEPIREVYTNGRCAVGAHLHGWTTPPFEEEVNERNSYECNLPADLEFLKLKALTGKIAESFGAPPLFFKAGRYGAGPSTYDALRALGFAVDFSLYPFADFRNTGGPDFRAVRPQVYRSKDDVMCVPMTRGQIGLLAPMNQGMSGLIQSRMGRMLKVPGVLARLGLLNTVTLTPEGIDVSEQKRLIDALFTQGARTFVLHYHSPSLVPGNTPYVRTHSDLAVFLNRIEVICKYFVNDIGGVPGNPADLVPHHLRDKVWPLAAPPREGRDARLLQTTRP
jgi:hypothetical protein